MGTEHHKTNAIYLCYIEFEKGQKSLLPIFTNLSNSYSKKHIKPFLKTILLLWAAKKNITTTTHEDRLPPVVEYRAISKVCPVVCVFFCSF